MTKDIVELGIYGLFTRNNPHVLSHLPQHVKDAAARVFNPEKVLGIDRYDLSFFIKNVEHADSIDMRTAFVNCMSMNRGVDEHFADRAVQVIAVGCIHNEDTVLLLSMRNETYVDGYLQGTLTYPQGHCGWSADFASRKQEKGWRISDVIERVKEELFREIQEEIAIDSEYLHSTFMMELFDRLFRFPGNGIVYPIYINKPGTLCHHIGMVVDVDMSGTSFDTIQHEIHSGEPEKHEVVFAKFPDLLNLSRADVLCSWVSTSFSCIPFYTTSFIKRYLE